MAQNIYDDSGFFAAYACLDRSVAGLDGAPEWPVLRSLLPPVAGRRVVDLGCGFGRFARWAASEGAAAVVGFDLSTNMLDRARADTPASVPVTYAQVDLDQLALDPGTVDLAYSSLTLHYLADLPRFLGVVHDGLAPGGALVFSAEHPILTAPSHPDFVDGPTGRVWPLDRYLDEGPYTTDWLAEGVRKQHRTVATYVNDLIEAGFAIDRMEEWSPSAAQVEARPEWADEHHRPYFLLVAAHRS
ncbi:MAG TPA: methyltransferase domain-containing protein [Iamia sp.]|nr:methyltransferase domain-containing protein [Iamia sp.]